MTGDSAHIDLTVLQEMSETVGEDVTALVVQTYLRSAEPRRTALEQALPLGGRALRDAAHAMTAASATVGARRLADLLWQVEARAGDGDDDPARDVAGRAITEMEQVVTELGATRWAAPAG
jgi:HPt (histidine-containing phosphotransfer) domain-containing protein